jgi:malonyl-CoA O-methyltransferase
MNKPNNDPSISPLHALDKQRVRQSFDAAADHYDDVAVLQREIGNRILERLEIIRLEPDTILDLGAGTGVFTHALGKRYKKSRVIAYDIAPRMLQRARNRNGRISTLLNQWSNKHSFLCGDAEHLPLADQSIDLIFSNVALQWCTDLEHTFAEFRRVLKPGGLLMFSTFGPDTLKELRASWNAADSQTEQHTHVHDFIDMHDVGDAMLRAGMSDPVMDMETFTLTYTDAYQLMRELKTLGAHNVASQRRHSLTGKTRVKNMAAAYEQFRIDGMLPATYEVVYGHAWAPVTTHKDEVLVSFNQLRSGIHQP